MGMYDQRGVERAVADLLEASGAAGAALAETPARVAAMLRELWRGLEEPLDPPEVIAGPDGLVQLRDLPFYSLCEHHLLPFFGTADIAYLPQGGRLVGVGWLHRALTWHAARPQIQERLTAELADTVAAALRPRALRVRLSARQLCMEMRVGGPRAPVFVTESGHGEWEAIRWS
jgi:GTP cyclohydrolase I